MPKLYRARLAALCLLAGPPAVAAPLDLTLRASGLGLLTRPPSTITLTRDAPVAQPSFVHLEVEAGDSLAGIALSYGLVPRDIKLATGITDDELAVGQRLRVPLRPGRATHAPRLPPGVRVHRVKRGEVLSSIRAAYGVSEIELVSANPGIPSLDRMAEGTELMVPGRVRGLIWRLKPGQTLPDLADEFGVGIAAIARVNGISDPTARVGGDYVLLPGVTADRTLAALEKRRADELAAVARARALEEARRLARLAAERRERARLAAVEEARQAARQRAAAAAARRAAAAEERLVAQARAQRSNARRTRSVAASYRPAGVASGAYAWPLRAYRLTSGFGRRSLWVAGSNFHAGLDLAATTGTPIYAATAGTVVQAGWGGWGLNVIVGTGDNVTNIYGHMSRTAVSSGETVKRGQVVGFVGCTGACTGPHVHFEVQVNGAPRNPLSLLP